MEKRIEAETSHVKMQLTEEASAKIKRGQVSWAYFYTLLGFALTIETGVGSMFPLPWSFVGFLGIGAFTVYLVLFNGRFQDKLLAWKERYESAER